MRAPAVLLGFAVIVGLAVVGGLVWIMLNDPAPSPAAREISPGVWSTKAAPWSNEAQGGTFKTLSLWLLVWAPWPILGAWAQRQRGGNVGYGLVAGLLFGPLGLLVANYSGGRRCFVCRGSVARQATRCRHCQSELAAQARPLAR